MGESLSYLNYNSFFLRFEKRKLIHFFLSFSDHKFKMNERDWNEVKLLLLYYWASCNVWSSFDIFPKPQLPALLVAYVKTLVLTLLWPWTKHSRKRSKAEVISMSVAFLNARNHGRHLSAITKEYSRPSYVKIHANGRHK